MITTITTANINNWKSRCRNIAALLRGGYGNRGPIPSYFLATGPQIAFMELLAGVQREYGSIR